MLKVTKVDSIHAGQTIRAFGKEYKLESTRGSELYDLIGVCTDDGHLIMLDKVYKTKFGDDTGGFYYRVVNKDNSVSILQDSQLNVVQKK